MTQATVPQLRACVLRVTPGRRAIDAAAAAAAAAAVALRLVPGPGSVALVTLRTGRLEASAALAPHR